MKQALALLLCSLTVASAQVNEREVLLDFYKATGGHAWNENYGWVDSTGDVCDWYGVICDEEGLEDQGRRNEETDGEVLGLHLPANFVTGRTPTSLWTLPSLVSVDLSANPHLDVNFAGLQSEGSSPLLSLRMIGTATTSVTGVTGASDTLEEFFFSKNDLGSQIPADLFALTQLSVLQLAQCGLLGNIPDDINRLSLLRELSFYENSLTGTMPDAMADLIHLRHLTLSQNQFHGTIPDFINSFVMLNELWAFNNDFTGSIPSLHQAPEIHRIYLNGNSLEGDIPQNFIQQALAGPRTNVIHVNLESNSLGGSVPETLEYLANLEIVWRLGDNQWTDFSDMMCDNANWNEGAIEEFDCNGFLCPPGTFSHHGYETAETECHSCSSNEYYGSTNCFDKDDRTVLLELFDALEGAHWDRKDNWQSEDDFCTWYGVTCWDMGDSKDGRVRKLQLPNNNLRGEVPETIYNLLKATTFDLSRNDIVLPFTNIWEVTHMYSVDVSNTRTKDFDGIQYATAVFSELYADHVPISGTIPSEVLEIQSLKVLSLQECDLSGEISADIFGLTSLRELYLSNNNFKGNLLDRWDELESLEVLALAKNQLNGPIPNSLDLAPKLKAVSLQDQVTKGGGLSGSVSPFASTSSLRTLMLADNKLEGDLPEDLLTGVEGDLPITVDLSNNLITGKVHGTYDRFKRLNLFLEGNFITHVEEQLCAQVDWMFGSVGAYGCDALLCPAGSMGGRRQFADSTCTPCGSSSKVDDQITYMGQPTCADDESAELSERNILEKLFNKCGGSSWNANAFWMSDASICEWYGIDCDENGSVTSIQMGGNQMVGSVPTEIFLLPNLVHLKLYSNTLYFDFDGIDNAKNLNSLVLDSTGLRSLNGIGKARSLVELNVASNNLSGELPEELARLVNLQTLDVKRNKFHGKLPYWLRSLVSLSAFSASHNKLSGPVYDFATVEDMVYLDLSNNRLTGTVPATLLAGSAGSDTILVDLSFNKLHGTLPADLARHSKLSLQVQGNRISAIDEELCSAKSWNDGDVEEFGCEAILCPAGKWNHLGRKSNDDSPCKDCKDAEHMGTTHCSSGASLQTLGALVAGIVAWMLIA